MTGSPQKSKRAHDLHQPWDLGRDKWEDTADLPYNPGKIKPISEHPKQGGALPEPENNQQNEEESSIFQKVQKTTHNQLYDY